MESLISTFHIDWKLMIAQVINFIVVFIALYYLAAKPLRKLIKERTEEITSGIEKGEKNASLLEKTKKEYDQVLSKARFEANIIFKEGKKQAENKKVELLEEAKQEVNKIIENGKKNLEKQKIKMVNDAKKEIVSLIIKTTGKMIGDNADNVESKSQ